jgi:hypothetical protein
LEAKEDITFLLDQKSCSGALEGQKVPFKNIEDQLQTSKATSMRLLAHAKDHPNQPVKPRKMGIGLQNLV